MTDALTLTTLALEASHERMAWGLDPARLFGIHRDFTWVLVDEGEPYDIVELFNLLPGEDFVAVALVVEGWASPPTASGRAAIPDVSECARRWRLAVTATMCPCSGGGGTPPR